MLTLVTSNKNKAAQVERLLGTPIETAALDLPEIQSLNYQEVIEAKAREAFRVVGKPVIVDDAGASFNGLNGLPGPLFKWFETSVGLEGLCRIADGLPDRKMTATVIMGYFDGTEFTSYSAEQRGTVSDHPKGENGFGYDLIFIAEGDTRTRAELSTEEQDLRPLRKKALEDLKTYLAGRGIL